MVSRALFETTFGANNEARRTILYDDSPAFVLHRLAVRFGLPVLPEWTEWFRAELDRRGLVEELAGLNCSPIAVKGTKLRMLRILSQGLRRENALGFPRRVLPEIPMSTPTTISDYLRAYGNELGEKVLTQFPPLHSPGDPVWPALYQLKRKPFPAQTLAILGIVKRWVQARAAAVVVAECGTGKSLISLGSVFTHARGRGFTALVMCPPSLRDKWAREAYSTLPGVRVLIIDGVRNGVASNGYAGVNEVRWRNGRIVREGIKTTLTDMRLAKTHRSARARWWNCDFNHNLAALKP